MIYKCRQELVHTLMRNITENDLKPNDHNGIKEKLTRMGFLCRIIDQWLGLPEGTVERIDVY